MRAWSVASSIRTSPTPRSSSVLVLITLPPHRWIFHDSGDADNLAARDDERPGRALAPWHLRVDEDVLHLLAAAAEAIAGAPGTNLEAGSVRRDRPGAEADGAVLERDAVVFADGADAVAEVRFLRAGGGCEQLAQRPLARAREARAFLGRCEREQVLAGAGVELLGERQDLRADQTPFRRVVGAVLAVRKARIVAVGACLLGPEVEQRPDDAVLALRLDPARAAARDEPVENGLDLVGGGVTGCAQAIGRERVADAPQLVLGARRRGVDDLGPESVVA